MKKIVNIMAVFIISVIMINSFKPIQNEKYSIRLENKLNSINKQYVWDADNSNNVCTTKINKTYTIHYVVSGREVASETREYGNNTTIVNNPTSGEFSGWYTDSQMTTKIKSNYTSSLNIVEKKDRNNCVVGYEDVYLYGKPVDTCTTKINKTYTIHYVVSGREVASETREYGSNTTIVNNPTSGEFSGWYTDSQMTTKIKSNYTSSLNIVEKKDRNNCVVGYEDVYLYGKPVDTCTTKINKTYTIHYIVSGREVASETREYGSNTTIVNNPTSGEFSGWYTDSQMTTKIKSNYTSSLNIVEKKDRNNCVVGYEDVYLYGKPVDTCTTKINKTYTIHYVVSGREVASETREYGSNTTIVNNPTSGEFSGWYTDSQMTTKIKSNYTSSLNIVEKKDRNNCVVGYEDVYLYGKPVQKEAYSNSENSGVTIHYIIDGSEYKTESKKYEDGKEINVTLPNAKLVWYSDEDMSKVVNSTSSIKPTEVVNENNDVVGYEDVYFYAKTIKTDESKNNNSTNNNSIIAYLIGAIVIIIVGSIVYKKLSHK